MRESTIMSKTGPIVIVGDDADDRFLIKEVLFEMGVKNPLKFFNNGMEVLEYLYQHAPKTFLILCDVNMPVVNGLQLQKAIDEDPVLRKKSIPFIFLSTTARAIEVNEAFERTVQGFFEKGRNLEELRKRLRLIIEYWSECKHPNSYEE